jgi:hypothetical protein
MKTNIIASIGVSVLVVITLAIAGFLKIPLVAALADATSSPPISTDSTSSPPSSTDSTTTPLVLQASISSAPVEDTASSTQVSIPVNDSASTTVETRSPSASVAPKEPPPQGLTLVHIVGTKYTDYFIDGTTTVAFPGDPDIDSHFNVADAPIPTHDGLTWAHTTGDNLYDTPSGNLEVGDYAVQADGSYIANAPPFVSSTSTVPALETSNTSGTPSSTSAASPAVVGTSTSTVPASQATLTTSTLTTGSAATTTATPEVNAQPAASSTSASATLTPPITPPTSSSSTTGTITATTTTL